MLISDSLNDLLVHATVMRLDDVVKGRAEEADDSTNKLGVVNQVAGKSVVVRRKLELGQHPSNLIDKMNEEELGLEGEPSPHISIVHVVDGYLWDGQEMTKPSIVAKEDIVLLPRWEDSGWVRGLFKLRRLRENSEARN